MTDTSSALLAGVKRIAVLRPNAVGDFIMALPALHALRIAYPGAEIVYIGRQWHADFLARRPGPVDRVAVMPSCPGIGLPPDAEVDQEILQRFIDGWRAAQLDLAVQLYGGGRYSNPFIAKLEAGLTIGMRTPDAAALDRWVGYGALQNRRLQMLGVAGLVGADTIRVGRELQVTEGDRHAARTIVAAACGKKLVVLQPGSTDRRRCWRPEYFAAVGDRLAAQGALIAINGTAEEAPLVARVREAMRHPVLDLSGRLSLSGLCGLLERADMLISNDTGPLHLALAIGTPSVGIFWLTNLIESGPLRQDTHRAALSLRTQCPVCGAQNTQSRCPHDVSFVDDVTIEEVLALVLELSPGSALDGMQSDSGPLQ